MCNMLPAARTALSGCSPCPHVAQGTLGPAGAPNLAGGAAQLLLRIATSRVLPCTSLSAGPWRAGLSPLTDYIAQAGGG